MKGRSHVHEGWPMVRAPKGPSSQSVPTYGKAAQGTGATQGGNTMAWMRTMQHGSEVRGTYLCARASSSTRGKSCSSTLSQRSRQLHSQSGLTTCKCLHSCAWRTFSVPVETTRQTVPAPGEWASRTQTGGQGYPGKGAVGSCMLDHAPAHSTEPGGQA